MCRLLFVKEAKLFSPTPHLQAFARVAKTSPEYQGHGWGLAYQIKGTWQYYKSLSPIWDDRLDQFPDVEILIAHARSAFQDQGISVDNNMPFWDNEHIFVFNGELKNVKINEQGRIGAEKLFHFIKRFYYNNNTLEALLKGTSSIHKRCEYIKAMNIILADKEHIYVSSYFNENPDYYTLYEKRFIDSVVVCSAPYPLQEQTDWTPIPNQTVRIY